MDSANTGTLGEFHYWKNPKPDELGRSATEFLNLLGGPTHIHLSGKNPQRCRAAVTLLHGNEPSGFFAIYKLLKEQLQPAIDVHFFIASVEAAKQTPGFAYRMLPTHKDLNRCFNRPLQNDEEVTEQDRLAAKLIETLAEIKPESVLDIHNTSGSGPAFGVTTFMDSKHDALVSLFTHRMIVTDLKLGSLMEISESMMPTVTIECGGAQDLESHEVAHEGLRAYMLSDDVLANVEGELALEFFEHPIRLELSSDADIAYGTQQLIRTGVTLLPQVEHFNFGDVDENTHLGFAALPLSQRLQAIDSGGEDRLEEFFQLRGNELYPKRKLKFFMVTTNPEIAKKDCLLYFVTAA